MAGFEKYERYLNKKRKQEAYINLVTDKDQSCSVGTDGRHTGETLNNAEQHVSNSQSSDPMKSPNEDSLDACLKVRKQYLEIKKKMNAPKLFLARSGERALIKSDRGIRYPVSFSGFQYFLLHCLIHNEYYHGKEQWCNLLRSKHISRVVLIIVDGLGLTELASINEWHKNSQLKETGTESNSSVVNADESEAEDSTCNSIASGSKDNVSPASDSKYSTRGRSNKKRKHADIGNKNDNKNQSVCEVYNDHSDKVSEAKSKRIRTTLKSDEIVDVSRNESIRKIQRSSNEEKPNRTIPLHEEKPNRTIPLHLINNPSNPQFSPTTHPKFTYLPLFNDLFPQFSPNFPLCLEVESPSQYTMEPIEELFSVFMSSNDCKKILEECDGDIEAAAKQNIVMKTYATEVLTEVKPAVEIGLKDKMNRLELLLSPRELTKHSFPFINSEYVPLHPVVDPVTPMSPMFGVDCEMCETSEGSELTRVAVVDEKFKVVYSSFVKPRRAIVNYLTQYSGITPAHLAKVTIYIEDVQNALRRILPKDAILVGHSLNGDLKALKMTHPYLIDTSLVYNLRGQREIRSSLKLLAQLFLKKIIQRGDVCGHDPAEDAAASLELALHKLQHDVSYGDMVKGGEFPFGLYEYKRTELTVRSEKTKSKSAAFLIQPIYLKNLYQCLKEYNISSAVFTTRDSLILFKRYLKANMHNTDLIAVKNINEVMREGGKALHKNKEFLVCHCKMSDSFLDPSKEAAKRELDILDRGIADIHAASPDNSVVITLFTGSPVSVPLDKRSSGVLFVDIKGQVRKNFFRRELNG